MQCALHQLGGDGVLDGPSGHLQGYLWDSDGRFSTDCHCCALQGVVTGHHTDGQPEEVSPHASNWENDPVNAPAWGWIQSGKLNTDAISILNQASTTEQTQQPAHVKLRQYLMMFWATDSEHCYTLSIYYLMSRNQPFIKQFGSQQFWAHLI